MQWNSALRSLRNSEFGHVTLYSDYAPTWLTDWLTGQPWFESRHGQVSIFPTNIDTCWRTHNSSDVWVRARICRRLKELGPADDISPYLVSRFRMSRITLFVTQQPKLGLAASFWGFLSLWHTHTHTHSCTPLNEWSDRRRGRYPRSTQQHSRLTFMSRAEIEPAVPANDRLQVNAFDRSVTGISGLYFYSLHTQALCTRGQTGLLDF
jgi:hypothetical protein